MISASVSTASVQHTAKVAMVCQGLGALVFGAVVLFAVGFLPMDAAHNAAHDTRHTLTFPCH